MSKGVKCWVKNLFFFFKSPPHVPVYISGVPVHFGYCPIFSTNVYRYTLVTVQFSVGCTGTLCPLSIF